MGDIRVQLHTPVRILFDAIFGQFAAAMIAKLCPEMIFAAAFAAVIGHFAGGHCHEQTACAFDNLDVADNKLIVQRHRTKGFQPVVLIGYHFDSDFADFHWSASQNLPSIVVNNSAYAVEVDS
jgi:hypothetical protein